MGQQKETRLSTIDGVVPNPDSLPDGCHFEPRCSLRQARCKGTEIPLYRVADDSEVRCVLYGPQIAEEAQNRC